MFGLGEDATEENILSLIAAHQKGQTEKMEQLQNDKLALESQLPKDKKASIEPNTLELAATTMDERIQMLVQKGNIIPDVGKKLQSILIGEQGKRNIYTLSLGDNASPSIATLVINALSDNDPIKIGEQTKAQVLSRETPGGEEEKEEADKEAGDAMLSGAGVEEEEK
jgi:hypothetical protein